MKRLSCLLIAAILFGSFISLPAGNQASAQEVSKDVLAKIRACSVSIVWEGRTVGSGTLFRRDNEMWVLTAKHVVHSGDWRKAGLTVAQRRVDGRVIGVQVDMVELSPDDDVALLRACKAIFPHGSDFHLGKSPPLDTAVVHCGSLAGQHHTVTRGYLVGIDRPDEAHEGKTRDQVDLSAQPGSSGGGVFLAESGLCIGMIVSGVQPSVIFMLPTRRIGITEGDK